jgi:hypothetical protein
VRQLAHETHRVGEEHDLAAGQRQTSRAGVEGREEPVLHHHAGVGETVEQRRLAGVRVAHERHLALARALAGPALGAARVAQRPQLPLQAGHASQQAPAVDLELRLARSTGADATGLLREGAPAAAQARQAVAQQGQLDLRLSFLAAGVLGEDVEDHRRAVDGRASEDLLEVALLRR